MYAGGSPLGPDGEQFIEGLPNGDGRKEKRRGRKKEREERKKKKPNAGLEPAALRLRV